MLRSTAFLLCLVFVFLLVVCDAAGTSPSRSRSVPSVRQRSPSHTPLKSLFDRGSICSCSANRQCCPIVDPIEGCEIHPECDNGQCIVPLTPNSINALNALNPNQDVNHRFRNIDWKQVERENEEIDTREGLEFVAANGPSRYTEIKEPISAADLNSAADELDIDQTLVATYSDSGTEFGLVNAVAANHEKVKCSCGQHMKCTVGNDSPCKRRNPYAWCKGYNLRVPPPVGGTVTVGICVISVVDYAHHRTVECRC